MKKNFITIAKGLGIVLPACLLASTAEARTPVIKDDAKSEVTIPHDSQLESNPVKERIAQSFNLESETSPYQVTHSNVHANYTIPHTNVHSNVTVDNQHYNSHSNTKAMHCDTHSNSKI